jgi:hypothetical protein
MTAGGGEGQVEPRAAGARPRYGWAGRVDAFLRLERESWVTCLSEHHATRLGGEAGAPQLAAWRDAWTHLQRALSAVVARQPAAASWGAVFEYELPREGGRRPDVVLLCQAAIVVVEFKRDSRPLQAYRDQVAGYVRDIGAYHSAAHGVCVRGVLALSTARNLLAESGDVVIASPDRLADAVVSHGSRGWGDAGAPGAAPGAPTLEVWLGGEYAPLPSLVQAARLLFAGDQLPAIKRAASAGVGEAVATLRRVAAEAEAAGERHLVFVTGVPGAGKTFVGLQFVYGHKASTSPGQTEAVLLSGNGPLIRVLSDALRSKAFVQSVHDYLREHAEPDAPAPCERVWVYDEAQRAWDATAVERLRGRAVSEPEDFVGLGARRDGWAMLVALIGAGQEIHVGEEAGLPGWRDALERSSTPWVVHCPPRVAAEFGALPGGSRVAPDASLDLTTSIRTHVAEDVQHWVAALLASDLAAAATLADRVRAQRFRLYVTRDIEAAAAYARRRFVGAPNARYGVLVSSSARGLDRFGVPNVMKARFFDPRWFNAAPEHPRSCCALREAATEFICQGLEVDAALVVWAGDMPWRGGAWAPQVSRRSRRAREARSPEQLLVNSYRVLLSRGRDCVVVVVPRDPGLDDVFAALCAAGMRPLDDAASDDAAVATTQTV